MPGVIPMPGHLYALEIIGVGIRVGMSKDGKERVRYHKSALKSYGVLFGRHHVSDQIADYISAEEILHRRIAHCRVKGTREVFAIDFEALVREIDEVASEVLHGVVPDSAVVFDAGAPQSSGWTTKSEIAREYGLRREAVSTVLETFDVPLVSVGGSLCVTDSDLERVRPQFEKLRDRRARRRAAVTSAT